MCRSEDQIVDDFMAHRIDAPEMVRRLAARRPAPPRLEPMEREPSAKTLARIRDALRRINAN